MVTSADGAASHKAGNKTGRPACINFQSVHLRAALQLRLLQSRDLTRPEDQLTEQHPTDLCLSINGLRQLQSRDLARPDVCQDQLSEQHPTDLCLSTSMWLWKTILAYLSGSLMPRL
ncbi:MAG: hypothetical protein HXX20_23285 [Chloroflexi bacterium]|nr:hypothetical protein [Chloroflexota bacterium]